MVPDSVPLTVRPDEMVPLPLIIRFPPAIMLPVVVIVGIERVSTKTPVRASIRWNNPLTPVIVKPETREVKTPVVPVIEVNLPTLPVIMAPDTSLVNTPDTPVTTVALTDVPVIAAPDN